MSGLKRDTNHLKNKIVVVVAAAVLVFDVLSTTLRTEGGIALGCHGSDTNSDAMTSSCWMVGTEIQL